MAAHSSRKSLLREPSPRIGHTSVLVNDNLYLWGGLVDDLPRVHDSPEKKRFLSWVDVFQLDSGDWIRRETSGTPPLGVEGYCCAAVGDSIYYYGGYCGHDKCYHNSVHKLNTSSLQWTMLTPYTQPPTKKRDSCMVAFRDDEEDILYVAGTNWTSGKRAYFGQNMFSLSNGTCMSDVVCYTD